MDKSEYISKGSTIKSIAFYIFVIGVFIIAIVNSIIFGLTTGEWKPLWDNSIGVITNGDYKMYESLNELKNVKGEEKLPFGYNTYLKQTIFFGLFYFIGGILIFWYVLVFFWGGWDLVETPKKYALLAVAIVLLWAFETGYTWIATDSIKPGFIGIGSVAKDIWTNQGTLINPGTIEFIRSTVIQSVNQTVSQNTIQ